MNSVLRKLKFEDFDETYDSFKREVLYSIFNQCGVTMKLVRLIKMH
jgi:hypothetical protein